ncbi:MAG: glycoside hydrolase family 2 TIM barrel-domain containing protein [Bacteroidota bacterium]
MKYVASLLTLLLIPIASAQDLPTGFPQTYRSKLSLNQGWKFLKGGPEASYYELGTDDSSWESVNVPHTLALTSLTLDGLQDEKTQLVFHREVSWYRKTLFIPAGNQKVFLEFEGAHQVTDLWVNGRHVGQHAVGGYTPFHFDVTDFVSKGSDNQITLRLDNRRSEVVPPDPGPFDYVKFSGLYRDVYLVQTHPVHINFNWESLTSGVNITTPTVDPVNKNATINVKTSVVNETVATVTAQLVTRIIDAEGLVVKKLTSDAPITPGQQYQFNQIGSLEDNVRLWGIDDPYLYRVNSVVVVDGEPVDFAETRIGLRKFVQDPVRGYVLNNEPIELIGFNRHQQYPYVGDAVPDALHYKDMAQFKEFGFNVMRTAHYPQDDALIDACDELGILVYEEAPTWISVSQEEEWWDNLDLAARVMIRNHRNHPSIVIWGAGINHRGYVPRLHDAVKQEDPKRLTASQGSRWTGWQASGLTDINANMLYGPFIWDRSEPLLAMEGRVGPEALTPYKQDPLMTGLIAWTAHAYYTFHPSHAKAQDPIDRTRSGMMTIFRYPRPQHQWYKSELLEEPVLEIQGNWTPETTELTVFSNAAEVVLSVNEEVLARSGPGENTIYDGLDHPPFLFEGLAYQKGDLKVQAVMPDGATMEKVILTEGKATRVALKIDTLDRRFVADGSDILMVYASVRDKAGNVISGTDHLIEFSVKGDGAVVGDRAGINANPMFTEYGVAPALIRAGHTVGPITISASAPGLKSASAEVELVAYDPDVIRRSAKPIYDFQRERVDIGARDQLLQFGWEPWNGTDGVEERYALKEFEGASVRVEPASEEGIVRWLGEMNVIGKYGFAYGDGLIGMDPEGVNLVLEGLPEGNYRLTTWHHAPRSNSDSMDPNKEKLKTLTVHKLPYAKEIVITSFAMMGNGGRDVRVTEGKEMQWEQPCTSVIEFESNGNSPVTINFSGKGGAGAWINAFELSEWYQK